MSLGDLVVILAIVAVGVWIYQHREKPPEYLGDGLAGERPIVGLEETRADVERLRAGRDAP